MSKQRKNENFNFNFIICSKHQFLTIKLYFIQQLLHIVKLSAFLKKIIYNVRFVNSNLKKNIQKTKE